MTQFAIHPSVDAGITKGSPGFSGGTLRCHCATDPVEVRVQSNVAHNHICGCTKCWKPDGAAFSMIGAVPSDMVEVTQHAEKLQVVDPKAPIHRFACRDCGVHMYGRVVDQNHPFHGLDFIHVELSPETGWAEPTFGAFVSSVIEGGGARPEQMDTVRARFAELGLPTYDCLNPPLMDFMSTHVAKRTGVLH